MDTSNKIAAGEVVERPFSVVKELIENSLDAGAQNINIEIIDGGHKSIKITDDGYGIHPDDIEKAFLSHATSKISDIEDIYKINTFGFRGEALASIASVAKVRLKSRTNDNEYGKEISVSGGQINYIKDIGCNVGTSIEVMDLFYNVPARLKFLKSPQRETALINDIIERLALVNSKVSFKVTNNGSKALTTYSSSEMKDTIRAIYGKSVCENIISFESHTDIASIYGYIGNAEISRGSRNNQSIFVNKRYIKNKLITTAVENAFKSFLTINKFPFFILFIDIFPELIDVNVHPTKSEIKFRDDRLLYKLVFDTVHGALREGIRDTFNIPVQSVLSINEDSFKDKELVQIPIDFKSNLNEDFKLPLDNMHYNYNNRADIFLDKGNLNENKNIYEPPSYSRTQDTINKASTDDAKFPYLEVLGQFNNTYILAQGGEELYILDQHAAHEKILFEKYYESLKSREVTAQVLATPIVLELSSEDYMIYEENIEIFRTSGFNIHNFGDNTINIREIPIILGEIQVKSLFLSIIDNIKAMGTGETALVKYDRIAKLACKSAIKANNKLSLMEMKHLIEELRYINNPFTCPHGRPTIIKITLNELEKRFKRIQ